jgi:hypothetical protein
MATQYTAGLTAGQVLTAATMNSIGAEWETWTPTITAGSGTFTTTVINNARFTRIQKLVILNLDLTITTVGTGGNGVIFTLPVTCKTGYEVGGSVGNWRERDVTGLTGVTAFASTTTFRLHRYDNSSALQGNGYGYGILAVYEAA